MASRWVVDTNVPIVANGHAKQASPACRAVCVRRLCQIMEADVVVIDDARLVLKEYGNRLRSSGQPGVGDAFLKWVLTNQGNPARCEQIHLVTDPSGQVVVPPALTGFDPSDRKFAALALAHPAQPPVLNATDSDWVLARRESEEAGVKVEFLCPELMPGTP